MLLLISVYYACIHSRLTYFVGWVQEDANVVVVDWSDGRAGDGWCGVRCGCCCSGMSMWFLSAGGAGAKEAASSHPNALKAHLSCL